jgi:threonine dehydratase
MLCLGNTMAVHVTDLYAARRNIAGVAIRTPLVPAWSLSTESRDVRLKLETTQPIGAFKLRGAANALAKLAPEQAGRGVACVSTGNHGRAIAYAARRLGIPACICMSKLVPANKVAAIKAVGADVGSRATARTRPSTRWIDWSRNRV